MDAQPAVFSGTLKVRACHLLWAKTPVQLTYHRQDYRHALPVLLIRLPSLLGGEFRVPLDPCVHPVRLLPLTERMASKREFVLEYGWQTKQVRLRAPDANTYTQWLRLLAEALESGRRPLASCCSEEPLQDLASTLNSSNATFNTTFRHRVLEEEEEDALLNIDDLGVNWQQPSDFFVLHHADYQPNWPQDALSPSNAAIGSCDGEGHPSQAKPYIPLESAAVIHQLFLQTRVLFFLL